MWWMIAVAYQKRCTHAYGEDPARYRLSQVLLLMGSSMVGSMLQLPGVGGGSQLATIAALEHIFDVPKELAASCGIMLWLVTFVAVIPLGLLLAHHERLSLRKLSAESNRKKRPAAARRLHRPADYHGASFACLARTEAPPDRPVTINAQLIPAP